MGIFYLIETFTPWISAISMYDFLLVPSLKKETGFINTDSSESINQFDKNLTSPVDTELKTISKETSKQISGNQIIKSTTSKQYYATKTISCFAVILCIGTIITLGFIYSQLHEAFPLYEWRFKCDYGMYNALETNEFLKCIGNLSLGYN